jgi:hypothetical protein
MENWMVLNFLPKEKGKYFGWKTQIFPLLLKCELLLLGQLKVFLGK